MNSAKRYNHGIAVIVAAVLSILLNFYQMFYVFGGSNMFRRPGGPPIQWMDQPILDVCLHLFFTFLIAYLLFLLNFRLLKYKVKGNLMIRIIATIVSVIILTFLFAHIHIAILKLESYMKMGWIGAYSSRDLLVTLVVLFSTQILSLNNQRQASMLEIQRLAAENIRSRYSALKMQVNPHFLFNSLNTLNALISSDPGKSQEYVQQLSSVLRHSLQNTDQTTLEEELRFTESFCYLMKIRYGESLIFSFSIDPRYNSCLVLPLCLQLLIENSIKHNVITSKQPLTIIVHTHTPGFITVSNRIQLKKEKEEGEGIGLVNLMERYRLMMRKEIEILNTADFFTVKIPLQYTEIKAE
ncbi:MAG: histidine kinase [Bacteroidales bacterium]|nr:histidine kinase [Bacteroidales bacterium]